MYKYNNIIENFNSNTNIQLELNNITSALTYLHNQITSLNTFIDANKNSPNIYNNTNISTKNIEIDSNLDKISNFINNYPDILNNKFIITNNTSLTIDNKIIMSGYELFDSVPDHNIILIKDNTPPTNTKAIIISNNGYVSSIHNRGSDNKITTKY